MKKQLINKGAISAIDDNKMKLIAINKADALAVSDNAIDAILDSFEGNLKEKKINKLLPSFTTDMSML